MATREGSGDLFFSWKKVKTPTLPKAGRVGHPENLKQKLRIAKSQLKDWPPAVASVVSDFLKEANLSKDEYSKCIDDSNSKERLELDLSEARSYGVNATPTVIVNGRKYLGFRDEAAFVAAINLAAQVSDKGRLGK